MAPNDNAAGRRQTHGLVIGGGLTGLLAARVLARHLDRVTLLDRQALPRLPELVRGVEPAVYPHVHVARGLGSLEALLPGLTSELVSSGAPLLNPVRDIAWLSLPRQGDGVSAPPASAMPMLTCSRELVEWHARRRVSMLPGVHLLEGVDVVGLAATGTQRRVSGVRVRSSRDPAQGDVRDTTFPADFIVDASGSGWAADSWLREIGYALPTSTLGRPDVVTRFATWSASATFRPLPMTATGMAATHPWRAVDVRGADDDDPRALLLPIERGRMMLTLRGTMADAPPVDAESLLRRAHALGLPTLTAALPRADQLGPLVVRRHAEADADAREPDAPGGWPGRFISFGVMSRWPDLADAADAMTLGLAVQTLDRLLGARDRGDAGDRLVGVAGAFQRALVRIVRSPGRLTSLDAHAHAHARALTA